MTRRRALLVAAAAVATLVVLVLIGVEPVFALAWAVAVAVLGVVLALADHARTPPPQRLDVVRHRAGGRSDVVRIAASLDARRGPVGSAASSRLRRLVERVVRARGVDPNDDGAVEQLLGTAALAALRGSALTRADVRDAVARVERLQRAEPHPSDDAKERNA